MRARRYLPRRTYTIVRCDGRAFHTWTRGLDKPYDAGFMGCMDAAALALCEDAAGAQFAFVQSDEISLLLTDFAKQDTQAWFDGCQNKIESVSASIVTMAFNIAAMGKFLTNATFDARAFVIPDRVEVENYFIDRQKDAERNSVTMLAQAYASHKQLQGKSVADRHEIIHKAGDNWAKHPVSFKHGRVIRKIDGVDCNPVSSWVVDTTTPVFTRERVYLTSLIPVPWAEDKE